MTQLKFDRQLLDFVLLRTLQNVPSREIAVEIDKSPTWVQTLRTHPIFKARRTEICNFIELILPAYPPNDSLPSAEDREA